MCAGSCSFVIEHHDQLQLKKEEFIYAYGSRGRVNHGEEGMGAGGQIKMPRDYGCNHKERESEGNEGRAVNSQRPPMVTFFL